ncbi:hypothetical protein [Streptomyces olivochromogenes]|uniref:Uncharacterized protein n=1 Tax=Streptomyces olivochromogenes TaxID=1963 RepID=A0A286PGL3_STROL|nr:hypothetical protein [Streptomyces olivochromogenes]GAX58692.1 hypothetical protein SO3561_10267 [Streptomyces olivochromogenes]
MYYRRGSQDGDNGSILRAFMEVDRATMGPEHLAAKLPAHARRHHDAPTTPTNKSTRKARPGIGGHTCRSQQPRHNDLSALAARPKNPEAVDGVSHER